MFHLIIPLVLTAEPASVETLLTRELARCAKDAGTTVHCERVAAFQKATAADTTPLFTIGTWLLEARRRSLSVSSSAPIIEQLRKGVRTSPLFKPSRTKRRTHRTSR